MKKLNIFFVVDVEGWAYAYNAQEQAKYSTHHITYKPLLEITMDDLKGIDILYIHGPDIWKPISDELIAKTRVMYPNIKIIGVYSCENELMYPDVDLIICISSNFYSRCCEMYKDYNIPIIFMPKGIDDEVFIPGEINSSFIVGWIGRNAEVKRTHLLDKLKFSIKRHSNHFGFFNHNRSRTPTIDFLHSISCLVLTSSSEALPRTVLEAMSSGLPVISTRVGSLPLLLEDKWLVPVNPEDVVVNEINNRLSLLSTSPEVCKEVGERNRNFIEKNWSWKKLMPYWDLIFTSLYRNHNVSIKIYDKKKRSNWNILTTWIGYVILKIMEVSHEIC